MSRQCKHWSLKLKYSNEQCLTNSISIYLCQHAKKKPFGIKEESRNEKKLIWRNLIMERSMKYVVLE